MAALRTFGNTNLNRVAQHRSADAGRSWMSCGRLSSGEAAVVGGDDLFGTPPPAVGVLTGEKDNMLFKERQSCFRF